MFSGQHTARAPRARFWRRLTLASGAALTLFSTSGAVAQMPRLQLPTANDALFRGGGEAFYQYVRRDFKGEVTFPWEGGQYGFVRDPVETAEGLVYVHFHEGIDIKPLRRDAAGEPLDDIVAIAAGRVVHCSEIAGHSNYGRYVVIEHQWGGSPYYSLYAHLSEIAVAPGVEVAAGQRIARLGHTGAGIDRERSHLHFEINVMLTKKFEDWYIAGAPTEPNYHGIYNGLNLAGFNVAKFYLAQRAKPSLTVPEFLAAEEIFFKVLTPATEQPPDLVRMYPWMSGGTAPTAKPASWEISFTRSGVPVRIVPSNQAVTVPTLSFVKPASVAYWMLTRRLVYGAGSQARLSPYGRRLIELIMALPKAGPAPVMSGEPGAAR
jgi:murein DD-endopeptidase MepM/ murein hydrolase activator NlpD